MADGGADAMETEAALAKRKEQFEVRSAGRVRRRQAVAGTGGGCCE
jgi:hypothetical protein